ARAQTGGSMAVTREVAAAAPSATSPAPDAAAPVARATAVVLDVDVLAAAHPALRGRALRLAALAAGAPGGALGSRHIAALETLVTAYRGQGPAGLPGGVVASRGCGRLAFARED